MKTISTEQKVWTILEIISASTEYLKSKGIDDARLNAELLLAHVLGYKRIDLYTNFDEALDELEREKYKALLRRRAAREPLQYILGESEFMGLRLHVDRRVLIPRPETEVLVEKTIELCKSYGEGGEAIKVLDIGTGCGNIAITVAKSVPSAVVTAIDISADALEVAMHNAELHGVSERVTFKQVDVLSSSNALADRTFDIVVSNPPYISKEEFALLPPEIWDYEPRVATCDEEDG
ncbi:MAG: peptide chain release factor N(5)-glutamine methyltransferase, partial [Bacteroidota bacterium]